MRVLKAARVLALACTGLYAGIILGDRMGATYGRPVLSVSDFILFQQIQHVHFKPLLLPITIGAVVGGLIWVLSLRPRWRSNEFWFAAAGTAAMTAAAVLTRFVNFPINDALMTWHAAAPPPNVRELWAPWEQVHTIRAALSVAAFVLQVFALSASNKGVVSSA
jgi:uncharacterized membrane protein